MPQTLHLKSVNGEVLKIRVKQDPASIITGNTGVVNAANLGGVGLFAQKNVNILEFKGLVAGSNITLTPSATGVTIASTGGGSSSGVTQSDFDFYTGTTAPSTYVTKVLFNAYTGTTSSILTGLDNDINYVSGQTANKVNTSLFNSYTGSTNTRIGTIESDYVTGGTSLGNYPIFVDKVGHRLRFKGLAQGAGITLTPTATGITISSNVTGITGYVTTGEFQQYTGTTVPQLLNLKVDKSVFNTYTGTTIPAALNLKVDKTVFNTYTGTTIPAALALKLDVSVFNGYTGTTNTRIGVIEADYITGATNLGSGQGIYSNVSAHKINLKSLKARGGIAVSGDTNHVTYYYTGSTGGGGAYIPLSGGTATGLVNFAVGARTYGDVFTLTGATTLTATHMGMTVLCNGTFTVTLPNSMNIGDKVTIINIGTGTITLAASGTLNSRSSYTKLANQYGGASAVYRASNTWVAMGDLSF